MAKAKTKNRKRNTDGDDLIDDDAASVEVAEKPERKTKATTHKAAAAEGRKVVAANTRKVKAAAASKAKATAKKTATSKKAKASSGKRPRTAVVHEAPKVGSKFIAKYKGKTHTMTVKTVKGETVYVVKGKAYKSPSAAAVSVVDTEQKNGWVFWSIV